MYSKSAVIFGYVATRKCLQCKFYISKMLKRRDDLVMNVEINYIKIWMNVTIF